MLVVLKLIFIDMNS